MSAITPAICCCDDTPLPSQYYRFKLCGSGCCDIPCDAGIINWCPAYALTQGFTVPPSGTCALVKYDCCVYEYLNTVALTPGSPCPPVGATGIWNAGTYLGTRTPNPGCCDLQTIDLPETCLFDEAYPLGPPFPASDCIAYVFEEYTNDDMWGTVPGKEVYVTSTITYCYETFGPNWDEPCDCPNPRTYTTASVTRAQPIGSCIPFASPADCAGQRNYVSTGTLTCAQCNPCQPCCGGTNPCSGPSPPGCDDPAKMYTVKTCYAVNPCLDEEFEPQYFEQDVLTITYDFCATQIDPLNPTALAALTALFGGGNMVVPWPAGTGFPLDVGISLKLCPYFSPFGCPCVNVFSGNAEHIAAAINALSVNAPHLSATANKIWGTCFWFGTRSTCQRCPGADPLDPPIQQSEPADELVFDRVEIVNSTTFKVILRGRSKKYYVCAGQTVESAYSTAFGCAYLTSDVVNLAISATGDVENGFERQCLSPAEYACGDRYSMRQIEQLPCDTTICDQYDSNSPVEGCLEVEGYPLTDVIVMGQVVVPGWQSSCGGFGMLPAESQIKCRAYPIVYTVTPCGGTIPSGYCIHPYDPSAVYQDAGVFCETSATPIQVT
jgi:hypothetical protein